MDQRVKEVINLMKGDLSRRLTPGALARKVNLSPAHLRYLFKAETGATLAQYLKTLRMEEARRLLEATFLNVKEIMARIGASDESHFLRDFKRTYGLTPAQYRERHRGRAGGKESG
ncbi:MAG TPA: helix-turn-helix domain-containing protein [Pyrinomonadaceae bacterium]|jgi:two-component system response regulator YesN